MFLLLVPGFLCLFLGAEPHQYHLIDVRKSWTEAQTFCRTFYTDLATVSNAEDMSGLFRNISALTSRKVYIGLRRSGVFSWHWSLPDGSLESWNFRNWRAGQPSSLFQDRCAVMEPNGEWSEDNCSTLRPFVCINASDSYVLVNVSSSWRGAQEHCRTFYTDLASARSSSENQAVNLASRSQQVWFGLFKDSWAWSDMSISSYRFWDTNLPNSATGQDCVVAMMSQAGRWNNASCAAANPFICNGLNVRTLPQQVTSPKLPTTQNQPTPDQNIAPQVATAAGSSSTSSGDNAKGTPATPEKRTNVIPPETFTSPQHFIKITDLTPETMDGSTSEQATATGPSAETTTRLQASETVTDISEGSAGTPHSGTITTRPTAPKQKTRSTEFADNATLAVPKPVQPQSTPTQSTSNISSNHVDTTDTTMAEIPKEFTIQGTTAVGNHATVLQQHTDHLILVKENATWSEAVKYCREHHVDLVSILSTQEQNSVEKKVSLASSNHVWLGLRYSCTFNFWFWIRNREPGCYQNWAPGHGTEGLNDCGMAGAIESSGEHRWVGRPQSDKLNFICFACVQCQTCSNGG